MKIIYSSGHNNDQACLVYDHIILNKTYKVISEERNVWVNKIASTIKRFQRNLKMRALANRRFLNKKKKLSQQHLDFLKELLSGISSVPLKVSSIKNRLETNFEEMQNVSESTIRRDLKARLNMSYKRMSIVNPKNLTNENVWRMIQSATLLKILSNYDIELIFMDKFSINSRTSKAYIWAEKGKKAIISHHCGAESFSIISGLSSKKFYPSEIK